MADPPPGALASLLSNPPAVPGLGGGSPLANAPLGSLAAAAKAYEDWWSRGINQFNAMTPTQLGETLGNGLVADIKAYHGSPHDFDKFDLSKIGTGEGAQAYGHGLYFAGNEDVAKAYRDKLQPGRGVEPTDIAARIMDATKGDPNSAITELQRRATAPHIGNDPESLQFKQRMADAINSIRNGTYRGKMYEVNIGADPSQLLDWDKPLSQQPQPVQQALTQLGVNPQGALLSKGSDLLRSPLFRGKVDEPKLNEAGIPGIQYLDQGSRDAGEGTRNYVMFDPSLITIVRKYGVIPPLATGAALAATPDNQQ